MSSALTGNKIKDSYQALLKIGTNGSLDPTTPITISDGLGNDTPLQLSADKLLTYYSGSNIGLNLDFTNNAYQLGEITTNSQFIIDANNNYAQITFQSTEYLLLDATNGSYKFGNYNYLNGLQINENVYTFDLYINGKQYFNIQDSANRLSVGNDYRIEFNDGNSAMLSFVNSSPIGFKFDALNYQFLFGDWQGTNNNTYLDVDDNNNKITAWTGKIEFNIDIEWILNGAALQSNTAGGSSGEHLCITLNGTQYKIALLNP